jgi:hypothetical protein
MVVGLLAMVRTATGFIWMVVWVVGFIKARRDFDVRYGGCYGSRDKVYFSSSFRGGKAGKRLWGGFSAAGGSA